VARHIPEGLLHEIRDGNCVAFVGAGFSAGGVHDWLSLLRRLAARPEVPADLRDNVSKQLERKPKDSLTLEAAAQTLRDALGKGFHDALRAALVRNPDDASISRRRDWLAHTPFRAVLTTNFDPFLSGEVASSKAYANVLRLPNKLWWSTNVWEKRGAASVVKLHGCVEHDDAATIVFTREDYRRRLHGDPSYTTFLRSLFCTRTLLYIGFSFTDAYLNELRSEVLALLGPLPQNRPIAYAIVNDVGGVEAQYWREHEGVELLSYDSKNCTDFRGFDEYLEAICDQTSPRAQLGKVLAGKKLLWVDANPQNNDDGRKLLEKAASGNGNDCTIVNVSKPADALSALGNRGPFDAVITSWGFMKGRRPDDVVCSSAEELIRGMRASDLWAPVIVFANPENARENRPAALRLGAYGFTSQWGELFGELSRLFGNAS